MNKTTFDLKVGDRVRTSWRCSKRLANRMGLLNNRIGLHRWEVRFDDGSMYGVADHLLELIPAPQATFDLDQGLALKDAGIAQVAQNNRAWLVKMRNYARMTSAFRGWVSSDDLREYANDYAQSVGHPTHPNAWGAVFKGQGWKVVGRTKSTLVSNHGREIRMWRWEE